MARARSRASGRARKALKPGPPPADNSRNVGIGGYPLADIRRLIRLVQRTGIGELEVRSGGRAIRIAAHSGMTPTVMAPGPSARMPAEPVAREPATPAAPPEKTVAITSPMVGTFYRAPAPDADPYVEVGDLVDIGQTVCIVEAMKLMNEIQSEVKGRVVRILIENSQPVEFGQPLFQVDPL